MWFSHHASGSTYEQNAPYLSCGVRSWRKQDHSLGIWSDATFSLHPGAWGNFLLNAYCEWEEIRADLCPGFSSEILFATGNTIRSLGQAVRPSGMIDSHRAEWTWELNTRFEFGLNRNSTFNPLKRHMKPWQRSAKIVKRIGQINFVYEAASHNVSL